MIGTIFRFIFLFSNSPLEYFQLPEIFTSRLQERAEIGVYPRILSDGLVQNDVLNFAVSSKSKGNADIDIIKLRFFRQDRVNEAKIFYLVNGEVCY